MLPSQQVCQLPPAPASWLQHMLVHALHRSNAPSRPARAQGLPPVSMPSHGIGGARAAMSCVWPASDPQHARHHVRQQLAHLAGPLHARRRVVQQLRNHDARQPGRQAAPRRALLHRALRSRAHHSAAEHITARHGTARKEGRHRSRSRSTPCTAPLIGALLQLTQNTAAHSPSDGHAASGCGAEPTRHAISPDEGGMLGQLGASLRVFVPMLGYLRACPCRPRNASSRG